MPGHRTHRRELVMRMLDEVIPLRSGIGKRFQNLGIRHDEVVLGFEFWVLSCRATNTNSNRSNLQPPLNSKSETPNSILQTPNPKLQTPNPKLQPKTQNPKPKAPPLR